MNKDIKEIMKSDIENLTAKENIKVTFGVVLLVILIFPVGIYLLLKSIFKNRKK
jgi:hypothetical protein